MDPQIQHERPEFQADMEPIEAVAHAGRSFPTITGGFVSIGHGALLLGCTVDDGALVGMNAAILNEAMSGEGPLVQPQPRCSKVLWFHRVPWSPGCQPRCVAN